jgi:hypothetical protein
MDTLARLLRLCLGGCRHRSFYRERRPLHGTQVLHLVCEDCGYAVPAVQRSAREHRRVVKSGAVRVSTARRRQAAGVVAIGESRDRQTSRSLAS